VAGFEEQLVGCNLGDVKTVEVTFPENYPDHLKEKKAIFNVKVLNLWRPVDEYNVIQTLCTDIKKEEDERKRKEYDAKIVTLKTKPYDKLKGEDKELLDAHISREASLKEAKEKAQAEEAKLKEVK